MHKCRPSVAPSLIVFRTLGGVPGMLGGKGAAPHRLHVLYKHSPLVERNNSRVLKWLMVLSLIINTVSKIGKNRY